MIVVKTGALLRRPRLLGDAVDRAARTDAFVPKERPDMRKHIGRWLLVLGTLVMPASVQAQELEKFLRPPLPLDRSVLDPAAPKQPDAAPLARPYIARAQDIGQGYFVPPVPFTGPLSHPRYTGGDGFYTFAEFMYYRQTRPLLSQSVAFRGFLDVNGGITGQPGGFVGSGAEALNTNMVNGPGTFQPGMNLGIGYKFRNGWAVSVEWMHLTESRYAATAGLLPITLNPRADLSDTFLFAPVSNFPQSFAGNSANVLVGGNPAFGSTFGIWNAASNMEIQFIQRFEQISVSKRIPAWEHDPSPSYA